MGFPIAEVSADGEILISKPPGTGGLLTVGTVAEQMLYEIGQSRHWVLIILFPLVTFHRRPPGLSPA